MNYFRKIMILFLLPLMIFSFLSLSCKEDEVTTPEENTIPYNVRYLLVNVFNCVKDAIEEEAPPPSINYILDMQNNSITVTYNNFYDSDSGGTISGSIFCLISVSTSGEIATMTVTGTLNISGYSFSKAEFDVILTLPWDSVDNEIGGEPTGVAGTITADGTVYHINDLDFLDLNGGGGGGGDEAITDPGFVVAGQASTDTSSSMIIFSKDGSEWGYPNVTEITTVGAADLKGIACDDNGNCMAVGQNGVILYSSNGTSWSTRTSGVTSYLKGVAYGNRTWVAVGEASGGAGQILYSTDNGSTWNIPAVSPVYSFIDVAYGEGFGTTRWIAASPSSNSYVSDDGTNWSLLDLNDVLDNANEGWISSICFGENIWLAVGMAGNVYYTQSDPSDPLNWSNSKITNAHLTGVTYGSGYFIAVGQGTETAVGNAGVIFRASDNSPGSWTALSHNLTSGNPLIDVAYGNSRWSILGNWGDHLLSTNDGDSWSVVGEDLYGAFAISYRP